MPPDGVLTVPLLRHQVFNCTLYFLLNFHKKFNLWNLWLGVDGRDINTVYKRLSKGKWALGIYCDKNLGSDNRLKYIFVLEMVISMFQGKEVGCPVSQYTDRNICISSCIVSFWNIMELKPSTLRQKLDILSYHFLILACK